MNRFVRGTTITLTANNFLQADGSAITPDSVSFRLNYPINNRGREDTTVNGELTGTDWSVDWDSSVAYPGTVFVSALADGTDSIVKDDQFQLTANQANPNP